MTTFTIPGSAEEAVEQLGSIGRRVHDLTRLLHAREWERAAIIACLVGPERGKGRPPKSVSIDTFPYSPSSLSELGIYGLRSHNTVAKYRNIWCRERAVPDFGDEVDLADLPPWTGEVRLVSAGRVAELRELRRPEREPEQIAPVIGLGVDEDAVNRQAAWEASQTPEVVVFTRNYDAAHLNIDKARELLRAARRTRDEDYPQLNKMQAYGVRGALTEMRNLIDELMPEITDKDGLVLKEGEHG